MKVVLAVLLVLCAAACTGETERGLKDSRPEFMREMKEVLSKSSIPFREDAEGFIRYSSKHDQAVNQIREALHKELQGGVVWGIDDQASREYLIGLLSGMGVKYILEPRADREWIRWYPKSETQEREVGLKLAEFRFKASQQKSAK